MYAHSHCASNRIKLHRALVTTHAVTRYNTSRLSCRTKNQPSYESSPPWEADVLRKTRQAMYVSHTTARSRKVYTFSAILKTWYSFTRRQRFYDDTNILCKVHFCYSLWREVILCLYRQYEIYRSFATRVSQLKILHFLVIGIERNVCRCTLNVMTQFAKTRRWRAVVASLHSKKITELQNL